MKTFMFSAGYGSLDQTSAPRRPRYESVYVTSYEGDFVFHGRRLWDEPFFRAVLFCDWGAADCMQRYGHHVAFAEVPLEQLATMLSMVARAGCTKVLDELLKVIPYEIFGQGSLPDFDLPYCRLEGVSLAHWIFFCATVWGPEGTHLVPGLYRRGRNARGLIVPRRCMESLVRWGMELDRIAVFAGITGTPWQIARDLAEWCVCGLAEQEDGALICLRDLYDRQAEALERNA